MSDIFDNPSSQVYDAYGKAVAAGQLFNDTLRRNAAFNALAKVYGPEAGDPERATQLQQLDQMRKMDPLLQEAQSLQNAGLGQENAFNAKHNPQVIAATDIANKTNQNSLDETTRLQKAQQVHTALGGAITTLGTKLQGVDDPNQRLALFDQEADQLAPLIGVDPTALKHQLAPYRAAVATRGADALPDMQAELDAALTANLSPEDRTKLGIAQTNLDIAQTKLAAAKKNGGLTPTQLAKQQQQATADAAALTSFNDTVTDIAAPGGAVDKAIAYIQQHPDSYGLVAKGIMGHGAADIAGTPAYELSQLLAPITSNVTLDKLAELKKTSSTGASGLGQLSDKEGEYLKTSSGSVDQGQSAQQLIAGLMKIRDTMLRSRDRMTAAYKSAYGADPTAAAQSDTSGTQTQDPAAQGDTSGAVDWQTYFGSQ